ncbi:MAG: hypothetical protein Pg6C_03980 [Treponemataceae bacterium]|nr:MAG: hypothetical protein Pg6C_03980 [Treponemataceae bacterium]
MEGFIGCSGLNRRGQRHIRIWSGKAKRLVSGSLALIFALSMSACFGGRSEKKLALRDVEIIGSMQKHLAVADGTYTISMSKQDKSVLVIALKLTLTDTISGDPEEAAENFAIVALDKNNARLDGYYFTVTSKDKFIALLEDINGASSTITFTGKGSVPASTILKNAVGLECFDLSATDITAEPVDSAGSSDQGGLGGLLQKATKGDGKPNLVVAVPELTPVGKVSENIITQYSGEITTALVGNPRIGKVIDHNQVAKVLKQHKFETGDWSDPKKVAEIGKAMNVNAIAYGTIVEREEKNALDFIGAKGKYSITLQLLDINTMEILASGTHDSSKLSDLKKMQIKELR